MLNIFRENKYICYIRARVVVIETMLDKGFLFDDA